LRTRTSFPFTIDWHYCYHAICQSHLCTIRKWISHSIALFKCCPLIHFKPQNQILYLWMLSFVNDFFKQHSFSSFIYMTKPLGCAMKYFYLM
jgi:hypothetical protein